jgi:SagB-type dehydrogenase family enzyme
MDLGGTSGQLDDQPLNLPEQDANQDDLTEIFHESTKFFRSTFLPQAATIVSFLTVPPYIARATRGFNSNSLLPREMLCQGAPDAANACASLGLRRSTRKFTGAPVLMEQIGSVLHHAMHANRIVPVSSTSSNYFRPYPSGGALYPTECHLFGLRVEGRQAFAAHYDQRTHEIAILDAEFDESRFRRCLCTPSEADGIALAIVLSSVFKRSTAKYGPRGYRFALLEAGHAAQNLCLTAASLGLGTCLIGGFFDDELNALCDADGVIESAVTCLLIGHSNLDAANDRYGTQSP